MHQTVREFFRSNGPTAHSKFRMSHNDAHMRISTTCVRYLMLCASKATSIGQAAGDKPWTPEQFEAYARYLSGRPFFNYALGFFKRHLQECGGFSGDAELIFQLSKKVNDGLAAYVLGNWIPEAWGQRNLGYKELDYSKDFRAKLLHTATRMGYPQVVEALLIAGAEVEARLDGKTPLMLAAESGYLTTARVLLDQGALMEARDGNQRLALHLAAANGHGPIVGLLLERGAYKEARDEKKQTALHLAAAGGHSLVVGLLISQGIDKEAKDRGEQTALHLAAANGHAPVIKLLIDRGANKEAKDRLGWGALHIAAWNGHETVLETLVQSLHLNKEERDQCGWTALHVAAMNGCNTAIRWLIERLGVDKEAKDDVGWTALHFVAALGLEDTAQLLINAMKADRNTRTIAGETAQDLAQK